MKPFLKTLFIFLTFFTAGFLAYANEIQYGYIKGTRGTSDVHLEYKGPGGEDHFRCSVSNTTCTRFDPKISPFRGSDALGSAPTPSPDAKYAIFPLGTVGTSQYALLSLSGGAPTALPILSDTVKRILWTSDSSRIVFVGSRNVFAYDISSKNLSSQGVTVPVYFLRASPEGKYLTYYTEVDDEHRLVNVETGDVTSIEGETPSYLEISQNEEWGAFKEVVSDRDVLRVVSLDEPDEIETAYDDAKMIDDYIFHDNRVYFTANADGPLEWSLFEYDPTSGEVEEIDEDVSYGDFMKVFGGKLLYYKVRGEHSDVYTYSRSGGSKRLPAISSSDTGSGLTRKVIEAGDRTAVLVENNEDGEKPLVLWLHGGPNRQTSIGYHSYLSYGVYDELLERLAEAGARVVKLDYIGSTGYGKKFENGLTKKMGKADVADVEEAIDDLTDTYETSDVYLIGNSYGGYLSLKYLVENPSDVDGVVSIAGVVDWEALVRQIPTTIFAKSFGGAPSAKTNKYYRAANILSGVDDIDEDTPIVIAYGTADTTIPPMQSKLFIEEAKDEDKNVTEVIFEGEDHILRKRSTLNRLCEEVTEAFNLSDSVCR